jgi:hypothetical protein
VLWLRWSSGGGRKVVVTTFGGVSFRYGVLVLFVTEHLGRCFFPATEISERMHFVFFFVFAALRRYYTHRWFSC